MPGEKLMFCQRPRRPIDLNALAVEVNRREGGAVKLPQAQVAEVQRHVLDCLAEEFARNPKGVIALLEGRQEKPSRTQRQGSPV